MFSVHSQGNSFFLCTLNFFRSILSLLRMPEDCLLIIFEADVMFFLKNSYAVLKKGVCFFVVNKICMKVYDALKIRFP